MKSLTGNFSSVRGWALLLALLLGAGLVVSACGDEETPAPTTPEPTPPPAPPPAPEPEPDPSGLGVPMNLKVSDRGAGSITWTWDAVEGASIYQAQFSADETFTELDQIHFVLQGTSYTAQRVSSGYLRVRSVGGTTAEPVLSEWSDAVSGAAAARTPLSTPADLTAGETTESSVALSWSAVDDAARYLVEYRVAGAGGSWNDADCDDSGSGTVEDTSCTVTDLNASTDYEFQVRALPASDDVVNGPSGWTDVEAGTEGARETTTPGGMGDLNVTWETTETGITFSWEPMAGATYEWKEIVPSGASAADLAALQKMDNPCGGTFFAADTTTGPRFQHPVAAAAGTVQGVCVRTTDEDNRATSFAWGVANPVPPVVAADGGRTINDMRAVTALDWTTVNVKDGFEWELRLVSDPGRDDGDLDGEPGKAVQAACSAGTFVDQGEADLNLTLTYTWDGSIAYYSGYLLCLRYANTAGTTDWSVPLTGTNINEIYTTPAAPPTPGHDSSRAETSADGNTRTLEWSVNVRSLTNVPRRADAFEAKVIHYPQRFDDPNTASTNLVGVSAPDLEDCDLSTGNSEGDQSQFTVATTTAADTLDGFKVNADITIPENTEESRNVRLCVRALKDSAGSTTDLPGRWVLGGSATVAKKTS